MSEWREVSWDEVRVGDVIGETRIPVLHIDDWQPTTSLKVGTWDASAVYVGRKIMEMLGVKVYRRVQPLPELLEALKQLRDEVREWNVVLTDATAAKQRAVLELADAAIARAEGREGHSHWEP